MLLLLLLSAELNLSKNLCKVDFFTFFSNYLGEGGAITIIVVGSLTTFFVYSIWLFTYRYRIILRHLDIESTSLTKLYMGLSNTVSKNSILMTYLNKIDKAKKPMLDAAINDSIRSATSGLTHLSIIASISPFIGLFGTVVGILRAFAKLSMQSSATMSVVAPAISEALVATAIGIFVAIFAYTFNLLLKRKAYELQSILKSQADILVAIEED